MNIISKILSTTTETGIRIIKVLGIGKNVKTVYNSQPFGIDSTPKKNFKGVVIDTASTGESVLIGLLNQEVKTEEGEIRLYSIKANDTESFYVYLKKDGTCEIGGNTNFAVKYNELKAEYDKTKLYLSTLKTATQSALVAIDALIPGTSAAFIATMTTQVLGDFSLAKNDKIKTV
jgi:hypothetical protein